METFLFAVGKAAETPPKEGDMALAGMAAVTADTDGEGLGEVLEIVGLAEMVLVLKVVEALGIVLALKA